MTAVEFVFLTPLVFLLLMATVQFAIYLYAKQAAQDAVRAGAAKAREEAASPIVGCMGSEAWRTDAQVEVTNRASAIAGTLLTIPSGGVKVDDVPDNSIQGACQFTVTVSLDAGVPKFLPWAPSVVHVVASGPVEQFVRHP